MSNLKIIKTKFKDYSHVVGITESVNSKDLEKYGSFDLKKDFSVVDLDIPNGWSGIGMELPSATVVFDLAGSSLSIRDRGAIDYVKKNQEIFSELTDLVYKEKGIIEKFPGDGISMHFPLSDSQNEAHPIKRAFSAISKMDNYLRSVTQLQRSQYRFTLTYGDDTIITKFGNYKHEEFISIGHAVNVAHKLEKCVKEEMCFIGMDSTSFEMCSINEKLSIISRVLNSDLRRNPLLSEQWYGVRY
ncbi:hypothetical protein [Psychrobacillus sp. FSL K6-2843]|uniref:hypothetical protein n=1 Tax=Psychrobacillus sp. FSL K6-2843 TaxID=2921549 RepID=UPI00315A4FD7